MKFKVFALASALAICAVATSAQDDSEQVTLRGYLVDARYASDLQSWETLAQKAKKYTRQRGLTKEAAERGFGLVRGSKFYPFDAKGNELALELLGKTGKAAGISVEVVGTLPKNTEAGAVAGSSKKWELGRDRIGRPTYEGVPKEESYGGSISFGRRKGGEVKLAVESLKEIESPGATP
ncbi:MAG: hypothetical protein H0T92_12820 [Pyrinomonadaceae bacterium]|nr:hypothetical protein [Pyrinomonadaceae bacterium]